MSGDDAAKSPAGDDELSRLQAWLAELFRRRRALTADSTLAPLAAERITGNDRLLPAEQLEIYREQFWLRHTASLVEDFPGLGGILGQRDWERLLEEYLDAHPPRDFSLRELGKELPGFVARQSWIEQRELCTDMARLEWAYIEAFDAADTTPLDAAELASIPEDAWERVQIELAPSLRLLELGYPVADLRRELRRSTGAVAIPNPDPRWLVVYRNPERELYDRSVTRGSFALLRALASGTPLVAACERAIGEVTDLAGEIESSVGAWFQHWAELGWIARVRSE
jgi:hypothetical protein